MTPPIAPANPATHDSVDVERRTNRDRRPITPLVLAEDGRCGWALVAKADCATSVVREQSKESVAYSLALIKSSRARGRAHAYRTIQASGRVCFALSVPARCVRRLFCLIVELWVWPTPTTRTIGFVCVRLSSLHHHRRPSAYCCVSCKRVARFDGANRFPSFPPPLRRCARVLALVGSLTPPIGTARSGRCYLRRYQSALVV